MDDGVYSGSHKEYFDCLDGGDDVEDGGRLRYDFDSLDEDTYQLLFDCSRIALDAYNKREGSDYTVNLVVKASEHFVSGSMYYITFQATNSKAHPQVFQSMVYEPFDGPKEAVLARPESSMPLNRRDYFIQESPEPPHHSPELYATYVNQLMKTQGFDVDVYLFHDPDVVHPMFNDTSPISAEIYYMLSDSSRIALDAYNQREGTDYSLNRVVKSCQQTAYDGPMYFITFEGKNSEDLFKDFQAKVYHPVNREKMVVLVRHKATDLMPSDKCSNMMKDLSTPPRDSCHAAELWETYLKQIKETEGFDIDVYLTNDSDVIKPMFNDTSPISAKTYYMLSNCSKISLDAYNQREGTDYTVNRVVKACTQTLAAGRMYFISFEAISNDGVQVLQAKVFEPAKGPNEINEVRKLIGPLSGKLALYCSDSCIARYLRARNWNVKKSTKMLKASLKWRLEYKPEEIRWNSKSVKDQIKYLVYSMENAIINLPPDQEQMVWLIEFHGFSVSNISVKVSRETAHVLQEHYPERLGVAILYDAPKIFEPFWTLIKPFLEQMTANKVNFVYSGDSNTRTIMDELFDMNQLEASLGGKNVADFEISNYAEMMREDDKKIPYIWKMEDASATSQLNLPIDSPSDHVHSESNFDASGEKTKPGHINGD